MTSGNKPARHWPLCRIDTILPPQAWGQIPNTVDYPLFRSFRTPTERRSFGRGFEAEIVPLGYCRYIFPVKLL